MSSDFRGERPPQLSACANRPPYEDMHKSQVISVNLLYWPTQLIIRYLRSTHQCTGPTVGQRSDLRRSSTKFVRVNTTPPTGLHLPVRTTSDCHRGSDGAETISVATRPPTYCSYCLHIRFTTLDRWGNYLLDIPTDIHTWPQNRVMLPIDALAEPEAGHQSTDSIPRRSAPDAVPIKPVIQSFIACLQLRLTDAVAPDIPPGSADQTTSPLWSQCA